MHKKIFYILSIFSFLVVLWACQKDEERPALRPDAGAGFLDIENEGYVVTLGAQAANEDESETGTWRIYNGENGRFDDVNDPKSNFYGDPGQVYLLGWELSRGNDYEASTIDVSFKKMTPVILTSVVDTIYNQISLHLKAEAPQFGATGQWEIVNGFDGRIENETNANAGFIGKAKETYTVKWILMYGEAEESLELTFSTDEFGAYAGEDQVDIKTAGTISDDKFFTLEGFLPAGATGEWEVFKGNPATVISVDNPNSLFKGMADTLYTMVWKVELDGMTATDTVDVRFRGKHGMFTDERDGQTYRFCEINGLEWMSENFNYEYNPGLGSLYYGYSDRSVIKDGTAVETDEQRKKYGRLYDWPSADAAAPEGWRLPTSLEKDLMMKSLGGSLYAEPKVKVGGSTGFDLNYPGYYNRYDGNDPSFRGTFEYMDTHGLYWTSDYAESSSFVPVYWVGDGVEGLGSTFISGWPQRAYLSVRYVRDVQQ